MCAQTIITDEEYIDKFLQNTGLISSSIENNTQNRYKWVMNFWKKRSKELRLPIIKFRKEDLIKIANDMKSKYQPATIANYFHVLSSFFNYLIENEKIIKEGDNPVNGIDLPPKCIRPLISLNESETRDYLDLLIKAIKSDRDDYFQEVLINMLPLDSGLGVTEVRRLNLEDIRKEKVEDILKKVNGRILEQIKAGVDPMSEMLCIHVIQKEGKDRLIPINSKPFLEVYEKSLIERKRRLQLIIDKLEQKLKLTPNTKRLIEHLQIAKRQKALFINPRGQRLSTRAIQRRVIKWRKRFNMMKKITPEKFRHSFGHQLVREGFSITDVQYLMGHADSNTTTNYLHADIEALNFQERNNPQKTGEKKDAK